MSCWILGHARCGSHYLADLLNLTGLFDQEFDEYIWEQIKDLRNTLVNPEPLDSKFILEYIKNNGWPKNLMMTRDHFALAGLIDDYKYIIKEQVPDLKIILLTRNFYERMISYYNCWFSFLSINQARKYIWFILAGLQFL